MLYGIGKNQKGAFLITVMIALGIISAVVGSIFIGLTKMNAKKDGITFYGLSMSVMSEQVISIIENDQAWRKTIDNNLSMSCLINNGATCTNTWTPFDLYLPDNTPFTATAGDQGFDSSGLTCTGYSSSTPSYNCVYKVRLFWRCSDPSCVSTITGGNLFAKSPSISIAMQFFYNSANDPNPSELNVTRSNVEFTRAKTSGQMSTFCESMSGTMEAGGMKCKIVYPTTNCRSGGLHMMVDQVVDGVVTCRFPTMFGNGTFPFMCNPGNAITGFINDHPTCDVF